jgi:membrane protein DedA with SNARE-associated domain
MLTQLIEWYLAGLEAGGLGLVALLMAVESSIVPLPSEVVIPPAAHLVWTGDRLHFLGEPLQGMSGLVALTIAGALGSWLGAAVMYWAARVAGRPLVLRFGRYVMIGPDKVEGAERWAANYGAMGVFVARLLPVVRHLIGIPAGIVRMNFVVYSLYTLVGSALWSAVLCAVGVRMGADVAQTSNLTHTLSIWLGGIGVVLFALYYLFVHRHMRRASVN